MLSKKYILTRRCDDDDYPESLMTPAFQISPDVEFKEVPTNGEEYLLTVMKERQNCAVVTNCNKDYSHFSKNQSYFIEEPPLAKSAPEKLKPTIEWQNIQVAEFSDVRMYISHLQAKEFPCPGKIKKARFDMASKESWRTFFETEEPTLCCAFGIRHNRLDRGLEVLIEILDEVKPGDTISYTIGRWIYAFLACTRQPLLSITVSILRDLARKCAEIRSHINEDDENAIDAVAPLNLFICLIARYFRQYDLADVSDTGDQ